MIKQKKKKIKKSFSFGAKTLKRSFHLEKGGKSLSFCFWESKRFLRDFITFKKILEHQVK